MSEDPGDNSNSSQEQTDRGGSLDVIRSEIDIRREELASRGDAFDSRVGLIIGSAGILIGLTVDDPTLLQVLAQAVAVAAALISGWALVPRVGSGISPRRLYTKYASKTPSETRKALLETRVWLYEQDEKRLNYKARRLMAGGALLIASVGLMLASGIVSYVTSENRQGGDHSSDCVQERTRHEFAPDCRWRPRTDTPSGHRSDR